MNVSEYVKEHRDRFVNEFRQVLQIPSVSGTDDMGDVVSWLVGRFKALGAEVDVVPTSGAPVVLASIGSGEKTILIYDHYDVQPPEPLPEWDSPPFAAEIRDDVVYARGSADNKGNLMARIHAVEALSRLNELNCRVLFCIEGEEEIGSPGLPRFVADNRDRLKGDGCIWEAGDVDETGRPVLYLGGKGICYLELEITDCRSDLHSGLASAVSNPVWRLVWALNTIKDDQERILINGFYDRVRRPGDYERELALKAGISPGVKDDYLLSNDAGALSEGLMFSPTATICGIEGGFTGEGSKTVLPRQAKVKLDFRLVPDQDPDEIEKLVRGHLVDKGFGDVKVTGLGHLPPARTSPDDPFVDVVRKAAVKLFEERPVVVPSMAGSGPLWLFIDELKIPTVGFGIAHPGSRTHAPNENVKLADYMQGVCMAAEVIREFSGV